MSADEAKGRLKSAAGEITDDDDLKREGTVDKVKGKAKDALDSIGDKVDSAGDRIKDAVNRD